MSRSHLLHRRGLARLALRLLATTLLGCTTQSVEATTEMEGTSSGGTSPELCTPGMSVECPCPGATPATQICRPDGSGYEPGACEMPGTSATSSTPGSTGSDESTGDPGGSTGESTGTTGGSDCGVDCESEAPPCHRGECDARTGACIFVPDDTLACDDGLFCTTGDACLAGECVGLPNDCGVEPGPCEVVACSERSRACTTETADDDTLCVDDPCQLETTCQDGACVGGFPNECLLAPVEPCSVPSCNPESGECEGAPLDCSGLDSADGCLVGGCNMDTGTCEAMPAAADTPCQLEDNPSPECSGGACDGAGACMPSPINEGGPCDDGLACTDPGTCEAGFCLPGLPTGALLFEDFESAPGWVTTGPWEIGLAQAGGTPGDPAMDHTPTADNAVAGVVLGGDYPTAVAPPVYLTSPSIDASGETNLVLTFWRWLESDYAPYVINRVEVYDGVAWVELWASGGSPGISDGAWAEQAYDISAAANADMRVRFSFELGSGGAFARSGWNVDDVAICPEP